MPNSKTMYIYYCYFTCTNTQVDSRGPSAPPPPPPTRLQCEKKWSPQVSTQNSKDEVPLLGEIPDLPLLVSTFAKKCCMMQVDENNIRLKQHPVFTTNINFTKEIWLLFFFRFSLSKILAYIVQRTYCKFFP